jgi:hypothetical protein
MESKKVIKIRYRFDEFMKRITTIPVELSIIILGDKVYNRQTLLAGKEVYGFTAGSEIIRDVYGQYWYHRTKNIDDNGYETYEPLPEYIVSEEYEAKRLPNMMIYPYIRISRNGDLLEFVENEARWRDDEKYVAEFMALNEQVLEKHRIYYSYFPGVEKIMGI